MKSELDFEAINDWLNERDDLPTRVMLYVVSFILVLWPWRRRG